MLGSVPVTPKAIDDYRPVVGDEQIDEIVRLGRSLAGARVLHVNSTSFGGGVAEILMTLVPLMNDVGLQADWQVIHGTDDFFRVTKAMHNNLQGMDVDWSPHMEQIWLDNNRQNAENFAGGYDYVVVHDPQPAALLSYLRETDPSRAGGKWVWRCHIDLTDSRPDVWDFLKGHVSHFDGAIFTARDYVKKDLAGPQVFIVPPAIDPLSPKNVELPGETHLQVLRRYGIDENRPFITQVSRFDPWKNPLAVIEVYRQLKQDFPGLQLVLVASMASDDPEGWTWYERTVRRAGEDYDIHILTNLNGVGNVEVNAFQRAQVVVQKSLREGFGLVVSEALWKGRPVVADRVGGIPLQLQHGETGYLVDSVEETIRYVAALLNDAPLADRMGAAGREFVRERFLITRYLRDYLTIFRTLGGDAPASVGAEEAS
ncbi:MAG: glycosyltransferase [Dehalococcoidia bacterium]